MRNDLHVVFGGVGLVKGDIKEAGQAMVEISQEINPFLTNDDFLTDAPFKLLHGIIRFGTKFDPYAQIGPIDSRHNELPFAVEIEMAPLKRAPKEHVKQAFLAAIIPALFGIASKYNLPTNGLKAFCELNGVPVS